MRAWLLISIVLMGTMSAAQSQGVVGDFTKSPTEWIINTIDQPIVVRAVTGHICFEHNGGETKEPLKNVLFEIQGPGPDRKIRHATTDEGGRFKVDHVHPGNTNSKRHAMDSDP